MHECACVCAGMLPMQEHVDPGGCKASLAIALHNTFLDSPPFVLRWSLTEPGDDCFCQSSWARSTGDPSVFPVLRDRHMPPHLAFHVDAEDPK